jgi:hypothetical protein
MRVCVCTLVAWASSSNCPRGRMILLLESWCLWLWWWSARPLNFFRELFIDQNRWIVLQLRLWLWLCMCMCSLSLFTLNEWILNYELIGSMLVSMRRRNWIELNIENQRERVKERMATTQHKKEGSNPNSPITPFFFFLSSTQPLPLLTPTPHTPLTRPNLYIHSTSSNFFSFCLIPINPFFHFLFSFSNQIHLFQIHPGLF